MPKISYVSHRFSAGSRHMIGQAETILAEYASQHIQLTLRGLYYQFVARKLVPENTQKQYKKLGDVMNNARLAGLIDWNSLQDNTRFLRGQNHWDTPKDFLKYAHHWYNRDKWEGQKVQPEVWIEKDALGGVVSNICNELDVPWFACRGYNSQSEAWLAGQRILARHRDEGKSTLILHFGDHDPSGVQMTEDNRDRIDLFTGSDICEVRRLALNMDQVQKYNPPPNPAKTTDSRFNRYEEEHGAESWEVDALEPRVIIELIRDNVLEVRDDDAWNAAVKREDKERGKLQKFFATYKE